jgi:hypothetical protein
VDEVIAVRDIATQHGKRRQTVFKVLKRLGIETTKLRASNSRNQLVAYITQEEYLRVRVELDAIDTRDDSEEDAEVGADEVGVFYLIQLEPEFDPGRFKLGFAVAISERLRHLRCSAPFAMVLRTWPCRPVWERTAIESVSVGCERLHTEVFRAASLDEVAARCDRFFAVMPPMQPIRPSQPLQQTVASLVPER